MDMTCCPTITNYRIYCITEDSFVEGFGQYPPEYCYRNGAHTINPDSVQEIGSYPVNRVAIDEDRGKTQGCYCWECFKLTDLTANAVTVKNLSLPIDFAILRVHAFPIEGNVGDTFSVCVPYKTVIGALTASITNTDNVLHVNDTVISHSLLGKFIDIDDGINSESLGRIVAIDAENMTLTMEKTPTNSYAELSAVKLTSYYVKDHIIATQAPLCFSASRQIAARFQRTQSLVLSITTHQQLTSKSSVSTWEYCSLNLPVVLLVKSLVSLGLSASNIHCWRSSV